MRQYNIELIPKNEHLHTCICLQFQYAISQLQITCSGLHLATYLNVGNFCDQSREMT